MTQPNAYTKWHYFIIINNHVVFTFLHLHDREMVVSYLCVKHEYTHSYSLTLADQSSVVVFFGYLILHY